MSVGSIPKVEYPWAWSADDLAQKLNSDLSSGLSEVEAIRRLEEEGRNELGTEKRTPAFIRFLGQFKSPVVLALIGATIVSIALGEWVDAIAIIVIVLLNAIISHYQESRAEEAADALKKLSAPRARVIRGGRVIEVPATEVCRGELLFFESGDYMPADARVIEARQLTAIEASLTGESLPVDKAILPIGKDAALGDRRNMLFAGTAIASGSGKALVTEIAMGTELGRIANLLKGTQSTATPLQRNLEKVGHKLLIASALVVLLIAILGVIRGDTALVVVLSAVSLAVAAIPEGLPAVVTVALTLAVRRMTSRNAIVRHLPSVEALGSTDVICTDKTGTLTTGKMSVREYALADARVRQANSSPVRASDREFDLLIAACLCNNASFESDGRSIGDSTEVALLKWAFESGFNCGELNKSFPRIFEWSFESVRKRMSVAVQRSDRVEIFIKGAPESVLPLCQVPDGSRANLENSVRELSSLGRRVLAVARAASLANNHGVAKLERLSADEIEKDLDFLGLVAIADPPREETIPAIRECKAAGIKVVMITGDHPVTARAIAKELGIVEEGIFDQVLAGPEIAQLSDQVLGDKVESTAVYARVTPEDKLRIVNAWKARGKVVAMTGDGVNDAPALKAASIGVSMGRGGTEVARQASAIILTDDNFATIVAAIEEGRAVFGNIRRTVEYLLSGNLAEILIMLGAAVLGWPVPLEPIHLLWINLVTDGLPSLALAAEPVPKNILKETRSASTRGFMDRVFYTRTAAIGLITGIMALAIYGYGLRIGDELEARTLAFSFLVYAELFRSFASRSERLVFFEVGPRSNLLHIAAVSFPIVFQFSLHHSRMFQDIFDVRSLSWLECGWILALTLVPVTCLEVYKLVSRRRRI